MDFLTITATPSGDGKPTTTRNTKVIGPDGAEIRGITHIELFASPNDVWRARIECLVRPPSEVSAIAEIYQRPCCAPAPASWWRRALVWLGIKA